MRAVNIIQQFARDLFDRPMGFLKGQPQTPRAQICAVQRIGLQPVIGMLIDLNRDPDGLFHTASNSSRAFNALLKVKADTSNVCAIPEMVSVPASSLWAA